MVYPVSCTAACSYVKVGVVRPNFGGGPDPPNPLSGCALATSFIPGRGYCNWLHAYAQWMSWKIKSLDGKDSYAEWADNTVDWCTLHTASLQEMSYSVQNVQTVTISSSGTERRCDIAPPIHAPRLQFMLNAWLHVCVINFRIIIIIIGQKQMESYIKEAEDYNKCRA